jgi:hypothetical protein
MGLLDFLNSNNTSSNKKKGQEILPVLPEEIYKAAKLELQDIIAPGALEISSKNLNLGDKISRTYFVISYPRTLTDNWFTPIINLDKIFDIAIHITPVDTVKILRNFQKKVAEVQSQINERESKGLVRDPKLDAAYNDLEALRDNLQQAEEKMFEFGLYITIYADTPDELAKTESEITSILEQYKESGSLTLKYLARGTSWMDCGTAESLIDASNYIRIIEQRQGFKIGCVEEIAHRNGWISIRDLKILADRYGSNEYGHYLDQLTK